MNLTAELAGNWDVSKKCLKLATRFMLELLLAAQPLPKGHAALAVAKEGEQAGLEARWQRKGMIKSQGKSHV